MFKKLGKKIDRWISNRRADEYQRKFDSGFGWAMAEYYIHRKHPYEIEAKIYDHAEAFDVSAFDLGAQAACDQIRYNINDKAKTTTN